ncbi:MAG TPA: GNAT family N-acetyltransferase [Kofleriaceae bacterium]|nr:GNAT family N-acetyltransferase [Kofleriaceae bacterium]
MRWISEGLAPAHVLDRFESGRPPLDEWLRRSAAHARAMRTARTFVWHAGDGVVVAYFSLAAHLLLRDVVPKRIGRGSPATIPAIMLARLALQRELHGQGLGGELLWDALSRAVEASEIAAARFVVVDAIDDDAARFYAHHGFTTIPGNPHRLVQKVSDVAAALGRRTVD